MPQYLITGEIRYRVIAEVDYLIEAEDEDAAFDKAVDLAVKQETELIYDGDTLFIREVEA